MFDSIVVFCGAALAITLNCDCALSNAWLLPLHSKKLTVSRYRKKSVIWVDVCD
jgi:hypothetical protein